MKQRSGEREGGFSLIETMAAITIFGVVTLGITPLLVSSLRGSALSRSFNFSKNLVQESMERVRGLPYYETAPGRDVLDLYFPNLGTGYSAAPVPTFTTTCTRTSATPSTSGVKACPPPNRTDGASRIPAGYTMTYAAQFVEPGGGAPQTYTPVAPATGYDAASVATSVPPTQLLRITIRLSWLQTGVPRSFSLTSLIGSRKLSPDRVRAAANVDFAVQAHTAYQVNLPTRVSALTATAGRSTSEIEIRSFTSASTETSAARQTLFREEFDNLTGTTTPGAILDTAVGAEATWRAPATVASTSAAGNESVTHPDLGVDVAAIAPSTVVNENSNINLSGVNAPLSTPVVQITNSLPKAASNFQFGTSLGTESWWANNQADTSDTAELRIELGSHILSLFRLGGNDRLRGWSYAEGTAVGAGRKVHAAAFTRVPEMEIIRSAITAPALVDDRGVVVIKNFQAKVECKTTDSTATTVVDGSWQADLTYWRDTTNNGIEDGGYAPTLPISGSINPDDEVDQLTTVGNPLVIDALLPENDVYLFEDASTIPARKGFLKTWTSTRRMESFKGNVSGSSGIEARVSMPYAINIVTGRTDPGNPETELTISLGKLNCRAVDQR